MSFGTRSTCVAVLLMFGGGAAQAAITADQLWAAWQSAGADAGLVVKADGSVREGSTLRLTGVTITPTASGEVQAGGVISELVLTEGTDGTVTLVPGPKLVITRSNGQEGSVVILSQEGFSMRVTENLGAIAYDVTATSMFLGMNISADSLMTLEDGTKPKTKTAFKLAITAPVVKITDTPDLNRTFVVDLTADSLSYDVNSDDAGLKSSTVQTSVTEDVAIKGTFLAPSTTALAGLTTAKAWSAALTEGMSLTVDAVQGASKGSSKDVNEFLPMEVDYSVLPGVSKMALSKDGFSLTSTADGAQVSVRSPMLPFPQLDLGIGALVIGMTAPIMAVAEAGAFGLTMKLADVVVNDAAWAVVDPNGVLPRDPAQLVIDTTGTMKVDFLALMAADAGGMVEVMPPEPLTFDITEVSLAVAGALFSGTGAFTFDNTTGQPVPVGTADVTLTGGNGLIDGLIAIGVLTEEDAGGARMMMAMFMNAGVGDDVLVSKIEAKADGSISVNGQRVQ